MLSGPWKRWIAMLNGTFVPLLVGLLILLVFTPLAEAWPLSSTILVSFVLITGVFAVHGNRLLRQVVVVFLAMVLGIRWLVHLHGEEHKSLVVVTHLAVGMYMLLLGLICVATVLRRERITRDTVLGAICGYILIAYFFTFVYAIIEDISPGSFSDTAAVSAYDRPRMGQIASELLYYSFTTLATVGYGDIVPVHRLARSVAILEMLAGPLYLAAFVARLVGAMNAGHSDGHDGSSDRPGP